MNLNERVELLLKKMSAPVVLPSDILSGFLEAWEKPGYGPAARYIAAAAAAGRLSELIDAADAAGRLGQLIDAADDNQKTRICDIMDIPK